MLGETFKLFANTLATSYHQNEPRIKIYAGVIGLVAAGVWACVSTVKNHDILEEGHKKVEELEAKLPKVEENEEEKAEETTEVKEIKNDILKVKAKTAGKVALNYAGPVALAVVSGGAIVSGERKYNERNLLGVAAVRALEKKYDKLLERVENKYGGKAKEELLNDIKPVKKEEVVEDPDTGKKKKRTVTKNEAGEDISKGFKLVLNRRNWAKLWSNDFDTNISQLKLIESELNNKLMALVAFNKGGSAVITAEDILKTIGWDGIDDTDIKRNIKNKGCVWTPNHEEYISLGLDQAQALKDFSVIDECEVCIHINFVDNIWSYR